MGKNHAVLFSKELISALRRSIYILHVLLTHRIRGLPWWYQLLTACMVVLTLSLQWLLLIIDPGIIVPKLFKGVPEPLVSHHHSPSSISSDQKCLVCQHVASGQLLTPTAYVVCRPHHRCPGYHRGRAARSYSLREGLQGQASTVSPMLVDFRFPYRLPFKNGVF